MNLLLLVGGGLALLVAGTLLGRYYAPDRRPLHRAAEEGKRFIRGLVASLEGNTEVAVEEIARAIRANASTVEAFFALGTLFRGRGEHERSVRVHQAILVRRDIDSKTRVQAHHQLALDFLAAGYPRRAQRALEYVVSKDKKRLGAWRDLASLYEENGIFDRAALALRHVAKLSNTDTSDSQGHLFAELARVKISDGDLDAARPSLRRALAISPTSPHVLHVLALYQMARKNPEAAAGAWEKALAGSPELAPYFVPHLERALFEIDRLDRFGSILDDLLETRREDPHLRLAAARFEAKRNPERALEALSSLLDEYPALIPARREAARLILAKGDPEAMRAAFEELLGILEGTASGYRCGACGHVSREVFWKCPGCKAWGQVKVAWGRRLGEGARVR